jgi:proton glutamate symport protein
MNSGTRTLIALAAGLAVGSIVKASRLPMLLDLANAMAPIGALWLSALKMTLVPLIFALVVSGVSSWTSLGQGGRMVGQTVALFAGMLTFAAVAAAVLMTAMLHFWPTQPGALSALAHGVQQARPAVPSLVDQIMALIPVNPVAAAAEGAMAPLVVFALIFGLALTRIDENRRAAIHAVVQGLGETMMVIVDWVLKITPLGVFVLALGVALNTGLQAAGALVQATVMNAALPVFGIGFCYLVARFGGGVPIARFAKGILGAQAVAAGTTSSMATLPAMIGAAETGLDCPPEVAGAILPMAVSTFRFGNVLLVVGMSVFAASASGLHPSLTQIAVVALVGILTNIGVAGLPAAAVLYAATAPAFQAVGAPLELLPLFIAISALPDIADTVCNVTADLAVTTVVRRMMLGRPMANAALAAAPS